MAYTRTTWSTGDTITATKLNNIEQGIVNLDNASGGGGGGSSSSELLVTVTKSTSGGSTSYTMDKTYAEIYNAFMAGTHVYVKYFSSTPSSLNNGNYSLNRGEVVTVYKYINAYRVSVSCSWYVTTTDGGNFLEVMAPTIATYGFTSSSSSSTTVGNNYPKLIRNVYAAPASCYYASSYPFD